MPKKTPLEKVPGPKGTKTKIPKDPLSQDRWWVKDASTAAGLVNSNIGFWRLNQQRRVRDYIMYARFYGTSQLGWLGGHSKLATTRRPIMDPLLATKNIIQSCVDTASSKVASNKTKPLFQSADGEWNAQKRCKQRNKFIKGLFDEQHTYELARLSFRDSGVFGDGLIQVYDRNGRVVHERVYPGEIFIDEGDAIITDPGHLPRELHRVKIMDRQQLLAMFPDKEDEIQAAPDATIEEYGSIRTLSRMVDVHESWRLPSSKNAGDGRHLISVGDQALTPMEVWKRERYPFARVACDPRLFGFFSQGIVEQLMNQQLQYNSLSYAINQAIEIAGQWQWWIPTNANINPSHLNNQTGAGIRSDGKPETFLKEAVMPETYARLKEIEQDMYNVVGISQMQANATIPAGMEDASGVAIREHDDIATQRFAIWGESFQEMMLEIARISVDTIQEIIERQKAAGEPQTYVVHAIGDKMGEDIDWADLAFEEDEEYIITCYPVSELPDTPEAKLAFAGELSQRGYYDEATLRAAFQFPDIDRIESLYNASFDHWNMVLSAAIEKGTPYEVEPIEDNLVMGKNLSIQYLNYAKVRKVPEKRIQVVRDILMAVETAIQAATPPAPPMGAPGPAGSPVGPIAPPVPQQPSPLAPQG